MEVDEILCLAFSRQTLSHFFSSPVSLGKNQNLKHEKIKWKSEVPLTDTQLKNRRTEFWETAPGM